MRFIVLLSIKFAWGVTGVFYLLSSSFLCFKKSNITKFSSKKYFTNCRWNGWRRSLTFDWMFSFFGRILQAVVLGRVRHVARQGRGWRVVQVFVLKRKSKFKFKFIMFIMLWFPERKINTKINHILIDGLMTDSDSVFNLPWSEHSPVHFRLSFCPWQGRSDICCCRSSSCCSCKRLFEFIFNFFFWLFFFKQQTVDMK